MIFLIIVVKGGIFAAGLEIRKWSDARVAEEARLESVYTSKAYRGFESPSLRTHSTIFFRTVTIWYRRGTFFYSFVTAVYACDCGYVVKHICMFLQLWRKIVILKINPIEAWN